MLTKENIFDFKKEMLKLHKKDIRDFSLSPSTGEFEIKEGMRIVIPNNATEVIFTAAKDLCDYMFTSMGVSLFIKKGTPDDGEIYICTKNEVDIDLKNANSYKGFMVDVSDKILICGFDDRGAAQGVYFIEDEMTLAKAPYLAKKVTRRKPLFSPRMVHSGYGLDEFPDEHLAAIAHAGRDAIIVFVSAPFTTYKGAHLDFNELITRASKFGLDVYAYSLMPVNVNPKDEGAKEAFENVYGNLFKECPGFKGVVLVGESVEFPSSDPRVCAAGGEDGKPVIPTGKPRPGWFPCSDYPQWVELVRDSARKYNPDADIVFWTYNWGWAPKKERLELIENLPTDISLLVTYVMLEKYKVENITEYCSDYTLVFEGPGEYFTSEAEAAKKRGIKLYSMTNTGGRTWDLGPIPYLPMPHQWMKRFENMRKDHEKFGLSGIMECHHYGYTPSFIGDLSNVALCDTELTAEEHLMRILTKYFGKGNEHSINDALKRWSEAITNFTPSNEDQYGPFRVGPSYLLYLTQPVNIFPCWCYTDYPHFPTNDQPLNTVGTLRIPVEIGMLSKAKELMDKGVEIMESIENKNDALLKLINLGKFISCSILTGKNAKKWYIAKTKLLIEQDKSEIEKLFAELYKIADTELKNAESALPLVEVDSLLGHEPYMGYVCDTKMLTWKINHMKYVIETEIPRYKESFER